jgi:hypothetical protein
MIAYYYNYRYDLITFIVISISAKAQIINIVVQKN